MKPSIQPGCSEQGFTLLEILVTLIISSILAVILVQVIANQPGRSYQSIQIIDDDLALTSAFENITSDYHQLLKTNAAPLVTLQNRVGTGDDHFDYWSESVPIQVTQNYCMDLGKDDSADPGESNIRDACSFNDTVLKLTLTHANMSLTALFSRY